MATQNADPLNQTISLIIPVAPPYLKHPTPALNELGLPRKDHFTTQDVCKVLSIKPDTFRHRIRVGHYPEAEKLHGKRVFSLEHVRALVKLSEELVQNGVLRVSRRSVP